MSTYPTGVYNPTPKATGNTIAASFFNDPDGEITAIEDALLNGFAHAITVSTGGLTVSTGSVNVGGPSSLTTLQVNGNSTFAGAVTFSSGVTFSTGATVSTGVIRQNSLPAWNVFNSAAQAIAASTGAALTLDSQAFVRGNVEHTAASTQVRVTVNSTGLYDVQVLTHFHSGADPRPTIELRFNDSTVALGYELLDAGATQAIRAVAFSGTVLVDSSGYFVLRVRNLGVADASTWGSATAGRQTRFMGHFIG